MRKFATLLAGVAATALIAGAADAAQVTFNDISADWINVDPTNVQVFKTGATASMRWGNPFGNNATMQSGYDFTPASPQPFSVEVPPSPTDTFTLGTFDHLNFPITDVFLAGATLKVEIGSISVDGVERGPKIFRFDFSHDETPNEDDPCANGEPNNEGININGCADIVSVTTGSLSDSFQIGDAFYTLNIEGFLREGERTPTTNFETMENSQNMADLRAFLTVETGGTDVVEPGTLALIGTGLAGLGLAARRRRAA